MKEWFAETWLEPLFLYASARSQSVKKKGSPVRKKAHRSAVVLLTLAASLIGVVPQAQAAESIPELQWPAVNIGPRDQALATSPTGSVTAPCYDNGGQDLVSYNASGRLVRQLDRTSFIDGVKNCIMYPVVDKNDVLYGIPYGATTGGGTAYGPNLLAYNGNTLKWKYPAACNNGGETSYVVGANGNIYTTTRLGSGDVRLIGLAPELAAGQTQPTKVLDVDIPNDCSIKLHEYKDGIFLHGQSSAYGQYYSYGGKYLGQATIGNIWSERINADGRLYVAQPVAGTPRAINVSMYDPRTGAMAWTTLASTQSANVTDEEVIPLAGNGLLVRLRQQKMVGGAPAVPTEYVQVLVTLNSAGVKIQTVELPNLVNGNTFGATYVNADTYGRAIVTRAMAVKTTVSSPSTVPGIALGLYDPLAGTWGYQNAFMGDLQKAGGPSGHQLVVMHYQYAVRPVGNTVYLTANCTNNCASSVKKLFAVKVTGLGIDYPRGQVLTRTARDSASYVALGDSFSSGEGVPPFETATDITGVNTCHRSTGAYARLIAGTSPKIPSLGSNGFRACSGAVTTNVTDLEQWNESIQLDWWPDTTTQLVTLTIGGNDIGFADFASACVFSTCDVGSTAYTNSLGKINNTLPGALEATYKRILAYAPNAKIYVLGYPQVIANKSTSDGVDGRCLYMKDGNTNWGDARAARDIVTKLNTKISAAVTNVRALDAGNTRLTYVPMDAAGSPFAGHEVCGSDSTSWFQNIDQATGNPAYVFHPNSLGQQGYVSVASTAINAG